MQPNEPRPTLGYGASRFRTFWWGAAKFCGSCPGGGEWWPVEFFPAHNKGQGGLDNRCGACRLEKRNRARARRRRALE